MNQTKKLEQSIKELRRITGLPIDISPTEDQDLDEMISQIRSLCSVYKEAYNKEYVIRRWITGEMSDEEFYAYADRMHLNREEKRGLFLFEFKHDVYPEMITLLRNTFPDANSWILSLHQNQLVIIYQFPGRKNHDMREKAYELLDTMNTELMEQAVISYSNITENLSQLPDAYQKAYMALQIGRIFYSEKTIYSYEEMSFGSLIFSLPESICQEYIRTNLGEHFTTHQSPIFQSDILQTANCFLKNNLNIAETARQLHIHRNTLLYRLEQILNETGLDIRRFDHAMTYKICSMILLYQKHH